MLCLAQKSSKADTSRSIDPAGDLYKASLKLIDSSKYKEAIKVLEKAVKIKKDYAAAYNKMAFCQMQIKDFSLAQKNLELSMKYAPDNTGSLKYLGRACYLNKKYDLAKRYYDSAQKVNDHDVELLCFIAELRYFGQDLKGALETYNNILYEKPNYPEAYIGIGLIKFKQKEYLYAIKNIELGIQNNKGARLDDEVYSSLAQSKFETKQYKGAIKAYDTLLNRNPKNEEALTYRGASKINLGDFSGAIKDLDEVVKINPKSYIAYNFRGTAKGGLKQNIAALEDFDKCIKIKMDYPSVYVNRAAIKMASKDRRGACEDLNKADQLGSDIAIKYIQLYCNDNGSIGMER
ncbi:MAG: tetratricopeptide repeat protein [Bacteroidetes bacterium]|nr:tetratricopeptide repeat protein [Bacteroidota bacterium]